MARARNDASARGQTESLRIAGVAWAPYRIAYGFPAVSREPTQGARVAAMSDAIRVAVTGAGGQVAYAMLARLASGEVFGPDKKVVLQLLDIPKKPDWKGPTPTARQPLEIAEGN